jgi:hypothetical protein
MKIRDTGLTNNPREVRSMLMALLQDMPMGRPTLPVAQLETLSTHEKLFLLATCCASTITEVVWFMSGDDLLEAREGIDAIVQGIKDDLASRAAGK